MQILYNKENEKINNSTFEKQIIKANVENEYSEIITKRSDGINSITHRINKLNDSKVIKLHLILEKRFLRKDNKLHNIINKSNIHK